jgi:hypothetical protein
MVNGALKIECAKTSKPRTDLQPLPAHRRTHQMRDDQAARTDTHRAARNTIAEKWRIGSGFDHSSPARECEPVPHTCIGVRKFARFVRATTVPPVARRLSRTGISGSKIHYFSFTTNLNRNVLSATFALQFFSSGQHGRVS